MKYCIQLTNKYTGQVVNLGCTYASYDEANKEIDSDRICTKCNRTSIIPVPDEAVWTGKEYGYLRGTV